MSLILNLDQHFGSMPSCVAVVEQLLRMLLFLETEKQSIVDMKGRSLAVPLMVIRDKL